MHEIFVCLILWDILRSTDIVFSLFHQLHQLFFKLGLGWIQGLCHLLDAQFGVLDEQGKIFFVFEGQIYFLAVLSKILVVHHFLLGVCWGYPVRLAHLQSVRELLHCHSFPDHLRLIIFPCGWVQVLGTLVQHDDESQGRNHCWYGDRGQPCCADFESL